MLLWGLDKVSGTICWASKETRENSRLASQNTKPSWMVISLHVAVTCSITCQARKEKMGGGGGRGARELEHQRGEVWNWNLIPIHSPWASLNSRLLYSGRIPESKAFISSEVIFMLLPQLHYFTSANFFFIHFCLYWTSKSISKT